MKPPRFDYYDPTTVDEVLALLQEYGDDAKLMAGGQSLIPVLNMRLARPKVIIDLGKVAGLSYIREAQEYLAIGAMTRHAMAEKSDLVRRRQPLLSEAMRHIGHSQIRNRGTIGGSLVHADPSAELPAIMVALEATLCIIGPSGVREVPAEEFFLMYFTTCVQADELLTEIRLPVLPERTGYAFEELARRHGDFAFAGVACTLTLAEDGTVADCRLGLTGVGMTPVRARDAEDALKGNAPSAEAFAAAAEIVKGGIFPDSDVHGTAEYRTQVAGVLTERTLQKALERATSTEGGVRA